MDPPWNDWRNDKEVLGTEGSKEGEGEGHCMLTWGGRQSGDLVIAYDPPERRGIRRPDGLALEQDRRRSR